MSEVLELRSARENAIECVLSASNCYVETLSITAIDAQPGLVELVIKTQLLSAKNPAEKRVKSRTCIERSNLVELQQSVHKFLQMTGDFTNEI